MDIILKIDDSKLYSSKMSIGSLLDKAYKTQRQEKINELAYERKIFNAFGFWYLTLPENSRETMIKNINSTIDIDEFVDRNISDRELVVEAINRVRIANESRLKDNE